MNVLCTVKISCMVGLELRNIVSQDVLRESLVQWFACGVVFALIRMLHKSKTKVFVGRISHEARQYISLLKQIWCQSVKRSCI